MLPRHLRASEPGGPKPKLPESHRPEAAGSVAPVVSVSAVSSATSSRPSLEKFADAAGRSGSEGVRRSTLPSFASGSHGDDAGDDDADVPSTQCPQMAFVGARGRTPNLYWHAPDESQLRRHPRFIGLPHESLITLGSDASFKFVRQGTELWDELHVGRLTTGCLTGALGFQEDGVGRQLGMGNRGGSHGPMLGAFHRLRQGAMIFDSGMPIPKENSVNSQVVQKFNEQENKLGPLFPIDTNGAENQFAVNTNTSPSQKAGGSSKCGKKNAQRKKAKLKTPGADEKETLVVDANAVHSNDSIQSYSRWLTRRDPHSKAAAQRGEGGVRMAWGSAQEHGTFATLMLHHPTSVAEEVGLCVVDHSAIPAAWNLGALPPMGASPDGIITMDTAWFKGKKQGAPTRERLVVEVKNSSPFRKHGNGATFEVTDRDSYDHPPPYHMPQLQMEMLACGVTGGLLCMQSATRGVRVFYVKRDDDYVAAMLGVISDLYTQYVLTHTTPPENTFNHRKDHQALVRATKRIAAKCVLVEEIAHRQLPGEAYDTRAFV
mmetsp:Transcript_184/g.564  ORF Transcript_184/g.564 Transcript_184/m.564 type:complete len:546 (+) Transcript_184:23-1660(+)